MKFIHRLLAHAIVRVLSEDKSILLLGPSQSGKTSLLNRYISTDLSYDFREAPVRQNFEQNPDCLIQEIKAYQALSHSNTLISVRIDAIHKVPHLMNAIQYAIKHRLAKFILSCESVRQLDPTAWSVVELRMDTLSIDELKNRDLGLADLLLNGALPAVAVEKEPASKEALLTAYVNHYLESVRAESLVRNLVHFSKFLKCAAMRSGEVVNISSLAEEVGIARPTANEYYQIAEDTLMVERIEPLTYTHLGRRLSKTPRYLLFDLGVRRIAAGEGAVIPEKYYGDLFKQFVGLELLKLLRAIAPAAKLCYWKDHNGPEIDYVIKYHHHHIPIEVKYSDKPTVSDAKHLQLFREEYHCLSPALIVCKVANAIEISDTLLAISWRELPSTIRNIIGRASFAEINARQQQNEILEDVW